MTMRRLVVLTFVVSACGGDPTPHATVRDSAGVTIVSLAIPDRLPTLELVPLDTLGDSADDVLFEVRGAAFLPDGGLAVGNEGDLTVRVYGPDGQFQRTLGREGAGPCELRRVHVAGVLDDSVVVSDSRLQRVTFFASDGSGCRTVPLTGPADAYRSLTRAVGLIGDTLLVVFSQLSGNSGRLPPDREGSGQIPQLAAIADVRTGAVVHDMGEVGVDALYQAPMFPGVDGAPLAVMGRTPFGEAVYVETDGKLVYVFDNRAFEVRALDARGTLRKVIRVEGWVPRPVAEQDRLRHLEQWTRERGSAEGMMQSRRRLFEQIRYPETMTAYRRGLAAGTGEIWLEPYALWDGVRQQWLVLSVDGRVIGVGPFPYQARVLAVSDADVAVLERGPRDEEYIVRYRRTRQSRERP